MNKKLVKFISTCFLIVFAISAIFVLGFSTWNVSSIFEDYNKTDTIIKEYKENLRNEKLIYYHFPVIDSLLQVNPKRALDYTNKLLLEHPDNHRLILKKGVAYYQLDSLDRAIQSYRKSIQAHGFEYPRALEYIGWTLVDEKKYDEAIIEFKKAAKINSAYNIDIARVYELKKDFANARKYYEIALNEYETGSSKHIMWREIQDLKAKIDVLKKAGY